MSQAQVLYSSQYQRGAALFNTGLWWEAHEAWEQRWLTAEGEERAVLQALILLAASLHKRWHHGSLTHRNFDKAMKYLDALPPQYGALDLLKLRREVWGALHQAGVHPQLPLP